MFNNTKAKSNGQKVIKAFAMLPTVDHVNLGKQRPRFKICAWIVNDSKSHMSLREYIKLCKAVIAHNKKR